MSKERLEELAYNVGISLDGEKALMSSDDYDFLYNYALEQAELVQELEKKLEKESRVRKYLRNKNKLYLNTIRKAERLTDYEANVILRKALEGEE